MVSTIVNDTLFFEDAIAKDLKDDLTLTKILLAVDRGVFIRMRSSLRSTLSADSPLVTEAILDTRLL